MRTAQELFTISATHLLKQKFRCEDASSTCLYRGPEGMKCAVGALIPDEEYQEVMDPRGLEWLLDGHYLTAEREAEFRANRGLLLDLQHVHDRGLPPGTYGNTNTWRWRECLEAVAEKHGLQMPEVQS